MFNSTPPTRNNNNTPAIPTTEPPRPDLSLFFEQRHIVVVMPTIHDAVKKKTRFKSENANCVHIFYFYDTNDDNDNHEWWCPSVCACANCSHHVIRMVRMWTCVLYMSLSIISYWGSCRRWCGQIRGGSVGSSGQRITLYKNNRVPCGHKTRPIANYERASHDYRWRNCRYLVWRLLEIKYLVNRDGTIVGGQVAEEIAIFCQETYNRKKRYGMCDLG